jgi:hypothetical protein
MKFEPHNLSISNIFVSNEHTALEYYGYMLAIVVASKSTMARRIKTYLRTLRRSAGLTQRELGFLLGLKGGAVVSRMESLKRVPTLLWMRACVLVFDTRAPELFPGLFEEVLESVRQRARELYEQLQGNPSKTTRAKLDFLEQVLTRLESEREDAL